MKAARQVIGGLGNLMFKQAYLIAQMLRGELPDSYVQDQRYWADFEDIILGTFSEGIGDTRRGVVSIHIRRGDYLAAQHFHVNLCDTSYYERAVSMFPDAKFLVFCKDGQTTEQDESDRAWVTSYLNGIIPGRWEFSPITNSEHEDMNAMAECEHNIIANSTFSWWAARLNPNPEKVVVCPSQWFTDGIQRISIPEEWIKI